MTVVAETRTAAVAALVAVLMSGLVTADGDNPLCLL